MASYNLLQLYKQVFGLGAGAFSFSDQALGLGNAVSGAQAYAGVKLDGFIPGIIPAYPFLDTIGDAGLPAVNSVLGTPIYEQITLTIPAVQGSGGQVSSRQYDYVFPDWPLFDIAPSWTIKKENILGGNGTVKEYIQQDDFEIRIRGFLINYNSNDYPEQLVADFWKAINCQRSIGITSRVFNILNIHNIVVKSVRLPALEGYMNIQPFEIECVSDEAVELLIKKA